VDVARARAANPAQLFAWEPWSKETFARAVREHRFILLHGAAEWCHWCHVMEAVTYRDPEVGKLLRERFVAIRVDIDERPDIGERYGEWGWPATILFSPEAAELGKFRGFIPPDQLLEALKSVTTQTAPGADRATAGVEAATEPGPHSAPPAALAWIEDDLTSELDAYYDAEQGGWGKRQKSPLGDNAAFEVRRAEKGDDAALGRAVFSLERQRALMDPVWGGLYQYSVGGTWAEPHYEKLMTIQASNLEAYATVAAASHHADLLASAEDIVRYVARFLTSKDGTFYTNQDADLGAHDPKAAFVDGKTYYSKDEAARLALGVPWVDEHVYAHENGLMVAALVALYETSKDQKTLLMATKAADALLRTHVASDGSVRREATSNDDVRYLVDAVSLGRGLARLSSATHDDRYLVSAEKIATRALAAFAAPGGALFDRTLDANAQGAFAHRLQPFEQNVLAARFLVALGRVSRLTTWQGEAKRVLAAISTPRALGAQGRLLGAYLLAVDDVTHEPPTPPPARVPASHTATAAPHH
jgi:hypothetical protein